MIYYNHEEHEEHEEKLRKSKIYIASCFGIPVCLIDITGTKNVKKGSRRL